MFNFFIGRATLFFTYIFGLIPPTVFFLKIALVIWDLLCFHTNKKKNFFFCSSAVKTAIGNLIRITLNLYIAVDSIVILPI